MVSNQQVNRLNIPVKVLITMCAYFVAGIIGSFFSISPGFASAIWPAAGIGLACAVILGPVPAFIGVYIGALSINTISTLEYSGPFTFSSLLLPSIMALGASIQALAGALLLKKSVSFE